jgi:hypothetical protein
MTHGAVVRNAAGVAPGRRLVGARRDGAGLIVSDTR